MRYIDADHLQRWMIARWQESDPYTDKPFRADEILAQIDRELSIDIVRCSECVYCNVQNTKYLYAICERHGIEFKPFEDDTRTHGCAWGISRSEKPNNLKERSE